MTAALLIAVNIIIISCDENDNKGVKREASVRSGFSSIQQFGSMDLAPHKIIMGKTTVEYWPPNLDKTKFHNFNKDSVMELWPKDMSKEMRIRINEPKVYAIDDVPDIPVNIKEYSRQQEKFEAMLKPTETSIEEEKAKTDRSPVVFPTSMPTTRSPDREVAFVSRNGNKKRKLKKKVKPAAETTDSLTPPMVSVIEVMPNGEQPKIPQVTPIYEYIDEPVVNIFQPIRYTDVINNLSNLTAQTFGTTNNQNASDVVQVIDILPPMSIASATIVPSVEDFITTGQMNGSMSSDVLEINLNMNNSLSPIDIMLDQLKLAIEERDLAKIKRIVQSMDNDETELKKQNSEEKKAEAIEKTTEAMMALSSTVSIVKAPTKARSKIYLAPKVRTSTVSTTETPTTVLSEIYIASNVLSSTVFPIENAVTKRNKIYLAPKVRAGQKKLKQVKEISALDKNLIENSSASVTEIPTTTLKLTTEKRIVTSTVVKAEPLIARPTKRKRSHITPRTRQNLKSATRNGHVSSRRRSGQKQ